MRIACDTLGTIQGINEMGCHKKACLASRRARLSVEADPKRQGFVGFQVGQGGARAEATSVVGAKDARWNGKQCASEGGEHGIVG